MKKSQRIFAKLFQFQKVQLKCTFYVNTILIMGVSIPKGSIKMLYKDGFDNDKLVSIPKGSIKI